MTIQSFFAPRRDFAQEAKSSGTVRKELTVEIYSQYARQNVDWLEQESISNDDI